MCLCEWVMGCFETSWLFSLEEHWEIQNPQKIETWSSVMTDTFAFQVVYIVHPQFTKQLKLQQKKTQITKISFQGTDTSLNIWYLFSWSRNFIFLKIWRIFSTNLASEPVPTSSHIRIYLSNITFNTTFPSVLGSL